MKISRREILRSGLAAGVAVRIAGSKVRDSSFDPWIEIRADHLRQNVAEIRKRTASRPILAVIKNNGYGLGVVNAARLLEPLAGIHGLAVVKLAEAHALRDAGVRKPVLAMGPFDERDLEEAARRDISIMAYTPVAESIARIAGKIQKPVSLHVCVDTGIGRVGIPHGQALPLIRSLARQHGARLEGIMMTFTEDPEFDKEQMRRFESLLRELETDAIRPGARHAASSYALFQHPDSFLDMVRPGMAIYGVYPEAEFRSSPALRLRPALALKARVAYVKKLTAGESAGYGRAYEAQKDVWVATLPVGHADGWPRQAARGARVRIGGALYPVIASVSASHTIVEIGPERRVSLGDVATLFDWEEGSRPEDVSTGCGVSVYDLMMHLNPLLPREIR